MCEQLGKVFEILYGVSTGFTTGMMLKFSLASVLRYSNNIIIVMHLKQC